MNRRVSTAITAAMLLGCTAAASADPITITSDRRGTPVLAMVRDANGLARQSSVPEPGDVVTAAVSASTGTSSGVSTATVLSSFSDPLHMSGTGAANIAYNGLDLVDFSAASTFAVDFTATSPFSYAFNGAFNATSSTTGQSLFGGSFARWTTALFGNGAFVFRDVGVDTAGTRSFSGTLAAGQYRFFVDAASVGGFNGQGATGAASTDFDFALDLTPLDPSPSPTPEPASLLLLATGAAGLFRAYAARG